MGKSWISPNCSPGQGSAGTPEADSSEWQERIFPEHHKQADSSEWLNPNWIFPAEGAAQFDLEVAINRLIQKAIEQAGGNISKGEWSRAIARRCAKRLRTLSSPKGLSSNFL